MDGISSGLTDLQARYNEIWLHRCATLDKVRKESGDTDDTMDLIRGIDGILDSVKVKIRVPEAPHLQIGALPNPAELRSALEGAETILSQIDRTFR